MGIKIGPHNRLCAGLSLIEILTVVAIISIVYAIVMSTMAASKRRAKATVITSNFRQIGAARSIYEQDFGVAELSAIRMADYDAIPVSILGASDDPHPEGAYNAFAEKANRVLGSQVFKMTEYRLSYFAYGDSVAGDRDDAQRIYRDEVSERPFAGWLVFLLDTPNHSSFPSFVSKNKPRFVRLTNDGAVVQRQLPTRSRGQARGYSTSWFYGDLTADE